MLVRMESANSDKMDATVISYGDKMVAIPLTDEELSFYIHDVDRSKTLSNGLIYNI